MSEPTYEDAQILLQTAQWWTMAGVNEAMNWVWSDEFEADYDSFIEKHLVGSDKFGEVNKVLGVFETVGALWHNGLFNEQLLFDWMAVGRVWSRVGSIAVGIREAAGEPRLYEHFEALAAAAENY